MVIEMKVFTIVGGVNGAGKTSFLGALKFSRTDLGHIVDVVSIAVERKCSVLEAHKAAKKKVDEYLSKNITFTKETTISGQKTDEIAKAAKERGYMIHLFYIGINTYEESIKRIKNRVEMGGHNIEERDVDHSHHVRFNELINLLPYCDKAYFFDNANGFEEVAEYKNGKLIVKGDYRPDWITELKSMLGK